MERVIFCQKSPCLRGVQVQFGGLFASNVIQVAVISDWYGSYGSMRSRGHVKRLAFGDRGHAKCTMGPKQSMEEVLFGLKPPCLRGIAHSWPPMSPK